MASRGFLGGGDLYIDRYDPSTGQKIGRMGPYEVVKFEIKPNTELKELPSKGRSTYGQVIESVAIAKPADFSVTFGEVNREGLTLALLGTQTAINQGAGNITDEVTTAKLGKWVSLSKCNFASAGFTIKDSAGTDTYVLGTDYEVNYRMGMFRAMVGGSITEGQSLKAAGLYNAITGAKISGATQPQVRAELVLDGINFADQLPIIVTVWEGVISPDTAFDFLGDSFGTIPLKGRLKTPSGKAEPFTVELRDTAN